MFSPAILSAKRLLFLVNLVKLPDLNLSLPGAKAQPYKGFARVCLALTAAFNLGAGSKVLC